MTDYNDGKWHGWNGGECPVHGDSHVEYVTLNEPGISDAGSLDWNTEILPIIAFRVVKQHPEPREWWVVPTAHRGLAYAPSTAPGAILVREVLE